MKTSPFRSLLVEGCCESVAEVLLCAHAGAHRIELCRDLHSGGLTPQEHMVKEAASATHLPVWVLIRPRPGDFVYDDAEVAEMCRAIEEMDRAGATGVVVGLLDRAGEVNERQLSQLGAAAGRLGLAFHKAFDETADPVRAAEVCGRHSVQRILTSGAARTAWEGRHLLKQLVSRAERDPSWPRIMAGGGVRADHVEALVAETGLGEVHARAAAVPDLVRTLAPVERERP